MLAVSATIGVRAGVPPLHRWPRATPVVGVVGLGLVGVAATQAVSMLSLCLLVLPVGVFSGVLDVALNAAGSDEEERTARRFLPLAHAGFSFGLAGGSAGAAALLALGADCRGVGVADAVLLAVLAVVVAGGGWEPVAAQQVPDTSEQPEPVPARSNWRAYAVLGGLCGASFFVEDALQSWSAVHLTQTFHVGAGVAGAAPTAFGLAAGSSRTFLHVAGGRRASAVLLRIGGSVATAGILLAGLAPDAALAVLGVLLGGAGIAVCAPVLVGIAGRVGGVRAISAVGAAGYIGFVVAPPAVGGIAQASSLRVALVSLAALSVAIAMLARQVDR